MKRRILLAYLSILITCLPVFCQPSPTGTLRIKIMGIRNDRGFIAIGINKTPEGWPREPHLEYKWEKNRIENGVFTSVINDLPFGTYAISVLDDENRNLEMEMILGIPKEGWGFSMNPPVKLSAPKFSACSFQFNRPTMQITIDIRYMGSGMKR